MLKLIELRFVGIVLTCLLLTSCQTSSTSTNVKQPSSQKPTLSSSQQECIDLAEPSYLGNSTEADRKRSFLKFFAKNCFDTLAVLNLKPESYSFSSNYHTRGYPEQFQSKGLLLDLLDDGGDLPKNEQMAQKVAQALLGKGVPEAEIYLGSELQATDPKTSEQYFIYAASQNKCIAQAHLAYSYYEGAFTERNLAKAYFWSLQLQRKRTPGENLDIWRPDRLRLYYEDIDSSYGFVGRIAKLMKGSRGLCSFAVLKTSLERAFTDSNAKQKVTNLAMYWQNGDQVPIELNDIEFEEKTFKIAQANDGQKEDEQIDSPSDGIIKFVRPLININSLTQKRETEELYGSHSSSVYFIAASKSEKAFTLGKVATGTAIAISQNELLTNCHIVENRNYVVILSDDDALFKADLTQANFDKDTCIVKIEEPLPNFQTNFRAIDSLNIGEQVFAIGNPSGLDKSLSTGVISGIRELRGTKIIQTNTEISGGSSGGGLFDQMGNLIGITSFGLKGAEGLNFAVAIEEFIKFE